MRQRKDIDNFLEERTRKSVYRWVAKYMRFYEHDGILYNKNGKFYISCAEASFRFRDDPAYLELEIMKKFNVKFTKEENIACRCGSNSCFSANYNAYQTYLKCNNCKNKFIVDD